MNGEKHIFSAKKPPSISIQSYLDRIIKYSNDSDLASKLKQFEYITKNGLLEDIKDSRLPLISENLNKEEYFLKMID